MSEHKMGHIQEFSIYFKVLLALIGLTIATVLVSLVDFGIFNTLVALLVAAIKASLVVLYFMHGKYEDRITWAFIYYPLILLATLVGALFLDYGFRDKGQFTVGPISFDAMHQSQDADSHGATDDHGATTHDSHNADSADTHTDAHGEPSIMDPATEAHAAETPAVDMWEGVHGDVEAGRAKAKVLCIACHLIDGEGNALPGAPPFAETANNTEKTPEFLRTWLKAPQSVKPGTLMPQLPLTDADIENLITYLHTYAE